MLRRLRPAAIALTALLVAGGCSTRAGTGWIEPADSDRPTSTTGPALTASSPTSSRPASSSSTASSPITTGSAALPVDMVYCPSGADTRCEANSAAGSDYLATEVTGGIGGFRVVRVGSGVIASLNPDHVFYPASSIKVLVHLHAVRWAAAQGDPAEALLTPIPIYHDSCAGGGAYWTEPLGAVLAAMMIDSDNQRANAALDYFGREAVNATAGEVLGDSDTVLAHRFGCGGPANDPANQSTALDLSRMYERVAEEETLDAEAAALFASLMLGTPWPSLESLVAAEGEALGLAGETVEEFRAAIDLSYKAGWWGINLSVGGLLTLPAAPCPGDSPRRYAFAAFVDAADAVADGFEVSDVVTVVLRDEIRTALREQADPSCGG